MTRKVADSLPMCFCVLAVICTLLVISVFVHMILVVAIIISI